MHVLVMGVSGSGKSTVGSLLASRLELPFIEGDALHPQSNTEKMERGQALEDSDRRPWLALVRAEIERHPGGAVIACSALKEAYRRVLLGGLADARVVLLEGSEQQLDGRLRRRTGHFMPPALLGSQLAALEVPETALRLDVTLSPQELVDEIVEWLKAPAP